MEHAAALTAPAVPVPFFAQAAGWEAVRPLAESAIAESAAGADVVARFETAVAERVGAARAVAVRSGPAALELLLRAVGVEPGEEVVVPAFGGVEAASAVVRAGARPVFADIGPDLAIDPAAAAAAVTERTRALLVARPGHRPPDLAALGAVADRFALSLLEDTAVPAGPAGGGAALSCAADAPLGALGDAGVVLTDDDRLADTVEVLRGPGHLGARGLPPAVAAEAVLPGLNCPLGDVQAAVLLAKLTRLDADTARRAELAAAYTARLAEVVETPAECADAVFSGYLIGVERRAELAGHLAAHGVATEIRHRLATPAQPCFAHLGHRAGEFPAAEAAAARLIALPLYPDLAESPLDSSVERVCDLVLAFHGRPS
ncbi:DegT/DnrJ/EryC1/StrS family aminotransferase [Actinokineospora guangxiensis]|uniref:DegT/DnrJ/EryC1/StrS family aminotransferase n=1 Tax=Actinokineospora guangxiensis TaxID=1490288 RepID=A0ABW0ESB3_9PSEU